MKNKKEQSKKVENKKENARSLALLTLKKCEASGQFSNIALDLALNKSALESSDRALATTLFYGVIEKRITLDHIISCLSSRDIGDIDRDTLMLLRMGIYQLRFLDRIPDHAAINETVSLATAKTKGFVNAVLRSYTRQGRGIEFPSEKDGEARALSVRFSVCESLAEKLCATFGYEKSKSILSSLESKDLITLRTNTLKISRDELLAKVGGEKTPLSPHGIKTSGQVAGLYGFEDGMFYVQDEASQLCAMALDAKEGDVVVDTCSCPGSKSFGVALDMKNKGEIYSFDLHANKLSLVETMAKRLSIDIIKTEARDARKPREELIGKVDRVLCDVPCSGFGVLKKKPELRYKDPEVSCALPNIQYDILESSARYLRKGGVLVYSTCTIFPEENEKNIERFLAAHKEFSLCPFSVGELDCESGMITLLPDEHGTDGFFMAKLIKNG